MSINVDKVYQRVLSIARKEQRGYITPQEFNLFANQVQLDTFEQYFYDLNQFSRLPGNSTEYADMVDILEEKISLFEKTASLTLSVDRFVLPSDMYKIGTVFLNNNPAEQLTNKKYIDISRSKLTQPTDDFPVYVKNEDGLKVYGTTTASSGVSLNYTRKPAQVVWGYRVVQDNPLYDASASTDFELHPSDEVDLVLGILELAGISIKQLDIAQYADIEEKEKVQREKL